MFPGGCLALQLDLFPDHSCIVGKPDTTSVRARQGDYV
jgi:hypothetical protein